MDANTLLRRAQDAIRRGAHADAVRLCQQALKRAPNSPDAMVLMASAHLGARRHEDAKKWARKVLAVRPADEIASSNLAVVQLAEGRVSDAQRTLSGALRARPASVKLNALQAQVHNAAGRPDQAADLAAELIERGVVDPLVAREFGTAAPRVGREDEAAAYLRRCVGSAEIDDSQKAGLWMQLGRLLDGMGHCDEAFDAFERGNAPRRGAFDPDAFEAGVDRAIRGWSRYSVASRRDWGDASDRPVLIVGMPRSGTTLVEQILASHPRVAAGGELNDLLRAAGRLGRLPGDRLPLLEDPSVLDRRELGAAARDYARRLRRAGARAARATDKTPLNSLVLGLAAIMVPKARVIHCVRDPRDTCLSCYTHDFTGSMPFAYDLEHLGRFHRAHDRLMAHWRETLELPILEMAYEELVSDQEARTRELIDFVGLEWDDACLRFHESARTAVTASYAQVRQPIYRSSMERWRRYERRLEPLLRTLETRGRATG